MFRGLRFGSLVVVIILVVWLVAGCDVLPGISVPAAKSPAKVTEAWNIIFNHYVEKDQLNSDNLSEAAIRGILDAINDPYTSYLDARHYEIFQSSFEGELEGIGAQVGVREGNIVIIAPIAGSPAERAGIRAGDIILAVNGEPTADISLAEAILKIRGPKGTPVTLRVLHEEEAEPVEITIIRDTITVPSVEFSMVEGIALISISEFSERTGDEMSPVMTELSRQGATGIIIDLRGNPGGLLSAVTEVASYFLREGVVVKVKDNRGKVTDYPARPTGQVSDLPMVVLVDDSSASGSEVLAGALQDHRRATLAGSTTFGKGSVNQFFPLSDGSGIYLTVSRWLTPLGRPIEGVGLEPDVKLELTGEDAIRWAVDYLKGNAAASGAAPPSEALVIG
jgi:carboxyl-terminal processing protease